MLPSLLPLQQRMSRMWVAMRLCSEQEKICFLSAGYGYGVFYVAQDLSSAGLFAGDRRI